MKNKNIKQKIFFDEFDIEKVKILLCLDDNTLLNYTNYNDYTEEENKKYLNNLRNTFKNLLLNESNKIERTYILKDCNRLYCKGFGMQYFSNNILHFILPENSCEYDIKNCMPSILLYLYKKHNLPHKNLEYYCNNRDFLLKSVNMNKKDMNKLMNQDTYKIRNRKWLDKLITEVNNNKSQLFELENDKINIEYQNEKKDSKNFLSSMCCSIVFYYENKILEECTNRYKCIIPKYDGFLTDEDIDIDDLNEIGSEYNIKFDKKYADTPINETTYDENKLKEILYTKIIKAEFDGNYDELEEIVMNIPKRYSDNYDDWIKIITILRKYEFYDLAKFFSKKSKKYDENKFNDIYNNKLQCTNLDIGTLYYYSKENKTNYDKIKKKYLKEANSKKLEGEYENMEKEFNKSHFKVINKGVYCNINEFNNEIIVMKKQTLIDSYSHLKYKGIDAQGNDEDKSFINRYTSHNSIAPKIYTDMDYYADINQCPDNHYNLWSDFDAKTFKNVEIDEIGLDFILNHIKILCNHQEEVYEYFLDWLAHMFQRPWEKSVFIMFLSKEGTGKDMFISLIKLMIGKNKYFETPDAARDVFGNFNPKMLNAFLVNLSELEFMNVKGSLGKFKQFITGDTITINAKSKDVVEIKSFHRYLGTSNEMAKPIITKEGDRRTLLIACSNENKGNTEYFSKLAQYVRSKNVAYTFYKFLMDRPNADIFINKPIPKTTYQEDIKEHYEDNLITWLKDFTEQHLDSCDFDKQYTNKHLHEKYKKYLEENFGKDYKCTIKQFTLKMKIFINDDLKNENIIKIVKPCNKTSYNIDFKLLLKYFGLIHINCPLD